MIKDYLKTIGIRLELLSQDDKPTIHLKDTATYYRKTSDIDLIFLKWLISYQYPIASYKYYDGDFRNEMINSCQKLSLIENSSVSILSDDKYEELIYNYALTKIPSYDHASDYKILLYIYASLTTPKGTSSETPDNSILGFIIKHSEEELSLPLIRACIRIPIDRIEGVLISKESKNKKNIYKYKEKSLPYQIFHDYGKNDDFVETPLGQLPRYFFKMNFVELIIYILYLWLSDISTIAQYNTAMSQFKINSEVNRNAVVDITDENIRSLWEICTNSASRYSYFYHKKKSTTHDKLSDIFKNFVANIPEKNFIFAPSLITLLFNDMKPDDIRRRDKLLYEPKPYIFPIGNSSSINVQSSTWNTLSFLKMIILDPIFSRRSQKSNDIEKRFEEEKLSIPNDCHFNDTLEEYINSLNDHDKEIAQHLFSSRKHGFHFTYLYFEIFLYVYEHHSMFKTNQKMDFALSVLHLNAATHWFDAFMLMNDMPFDFRNYDFLYLKLLSIYPTFEPIIRCLSNITVSVSNDKVAVGYNGKTIQLENFLLEFYKKANKRLNLSRLLDIAKERYVNNSKPRMSLHSALCNHSRRIHLNDINPIYKWIYLCEHDEISEEELNQICDSGYRDFLHKKADSTSWRTPILLPDPFSDDFDVYDSNNFF